MTTETKEKSSKVQYVHFTIEGKWFTWFLRHLWVEGNEIKAIRMWTASFPEYSSVEYLKGFFLDLVSGKRKFIGVNSFDLVKDGTKYWNSEKGDKPNKSFPLLQSWEDVILLKKAKLYLSEIELRDFRLRRECGETHEAVHHHSLDWIDATIENRIENNLRSKVNSYYTDMRNISILIGLNLELSLIPDKTEQLDTKAFYSRGIGFKETGDTGISEGLKLFYEIMRTITPWDLYFKKKYDCDMLFISEEHIREICGVSNEKIEYYKMLPQIPSEEEINVAVQKIIPGIDLDRYIKQSIEESHREKIVSEDVRKTEWTSGYIDREGRFYGCADINHRNFSQDICELLNVSDCDKDDFDAQIYLDKQGWVVVSVNRFNWNEKIELTQAQKDIIYDYVTAKKIVKTAYNTFHSSQDRTYEEAFGK